MILYQSNTTNPHFNLACEEWLFKHQSDDIIFLYSNSPSVIVGKHQNAMREINLRFLRQHQIPVIRRLSGGGTVYHDEGNINFCFIKHGQEGNLINFKEFTAPVISMLSSLGLQAELGVKHEILVDGLKISGNAEHIFKTRVMHHGTLLFDSDLKILNESIRSEESLFIDKAVRSNRSQVQNLKPYFPKVFTREDFLLTLQEYLISYFPGTVHREFSTADMEAIRGIQVQKYEDIHWNFGYSPDYQFKKSIPYAAGELTIELSIHKSILKEVHIQLDKKDILLDELAQSLQGCLHHPDAMLDRIRDLKLDFPFRNLNPEEIAEWFY